MTRIPDPRELADMTLAELRALAMHPDPMTWGDRSMLVAAAVRRAPVRVGDRVRDRVTDRTGVVLSLVESSTIVLVQWDDESDLLPEDRGPTHIGAVRLDVLSLPVGTLVWHLGDRPGVGVVAEDLGLLDGRPCVAVTDPARPAQAFPGRGTGGTVHDVSDLVLAVHEPRRPDRWTACTAILDAVAAQLDEDVSRSPSSWGFDLVLPDGRIMSVETPSGDEDGDTLDAVHLTGWTEGDTGDYWLVETTHGVTGTLARIAELQAGAAPTTPWSDPR